MDQGKLVVINDEMARVNTDILGISELKFMGMGKFNSDNHYIYYCEQESLLGGEMKMAALSVRMKRSGKCFPIIRNMC